MNLLRLTSALALGLLLTACSTTPITGNSAFNMFSAAQDCELGTEAYSQFTAGATLVTTSYGNKGKWKTTVEKVMNDLASVAEDQGYAYEVKLIDDDGTVNAWCLPCGKMAVYTGILPICEDATGLAVVMGHEIGHAIARHGTQRMSMDSAVQALLSVATQDANLQDLGALAYQYGAALPFGRDHELEADHIGLVLMARAGYDPREAVTFWGRMDQLSGGGGSPEWLSTHPSHETRAQELEELMPMAMEIYLANQP
jgi:predicted Zn-dependent protease